MRFVPGQEKKKEEKRRSASGEWVGCKVSSLYD